MFIISGRLRAWVSYVGLAAFGTLVAHVLAYGIVPSQAHVDTGVHVHGYIPIATVFVVPFGIASLFVLARGLFGKKLRPPLRIGLRFLVSAQVGLFAVQEVAERVATGDGLTELLAEPAVAVGVVSQLGVAWVLVAVIRLTGGAVFWIVFRGELAIGELAAPDGYACSGRVAHTAGPVSRSSSAPRAPPSLLVSNAG